MVKPHKSADFDAIAGKIGLSPANGLSFAGKLRSGFAWWLVALAVRIDREIPADLTIMVLKHLARHPIREGE